MSKRTKEIINYALIFVFIFVAPTALFYHFNEKNDETFHRYVREDYETCYERAKRDSVDTRWCSEIRDAAKLAYSESRSGFNISHSLLLFSPVFFVLIITVGNLRKQVEELKEKIDV